MKSFFKFIASCLVAWLVWMGISYFYGKNIIKEFKDSYDESVEEQKQSLELVGDLKITSSGDYGYYTHTIEGILKNVSGKKLDYAQVSFVIYDKAGNNIGTAFDNASHIDTNGTWKFEAVYFGKEKNVTYNKVPEISSW